MASRFIKGLFEKTSILAGDWFVMQPDAEEDVAYKIKKSNAIDPLISGSGTTANGNAVNWGNGNDIDYETIINANGLVKLFLGGEFDPSKSFLQLFIAAVDWVHLASNSEKVYLDLVDAEGGTTASAFLFAEHNIQLQADNELTLNSPRTIIKGQAAVSGVTISFTATPTFNFDTKPGGNNQEMPVEGDVTTFATSNELNAGNYDVWLVNDGTPGRTVATPTGWTLIPGGDTHDDSANAINLYQFKVSPSGLKRYIIKNM